MELYEQIRREYEHGVGTIQGVARKLGIHRRMVREALGEAVPLRQRLDGSHRPVRVPYRDGQLCLVVLRYGPCETICVHRGPIASANVTAVPSVARLRCYAVSNVEF